MEKSIENIWKEGFESEAKLSSPVISNLYKKKSKLVIQQINSKSKKDNLSLIPVALIIFGILAFMGEMIIGIYAVILITTLFFVNKEMLKDLETVDTKDNTYSYLLNYKNQVKKIMKYSTWIAGFGLPLAILPAYWMFFEDSKIMAKFNTLHLGMEILIVMGLALLLSAIAILGYRLSTQVVYGSLLEKLENTIEDMEELMET
ncbi:hypothetical protein [Mesonia sp.]|uniref:hypothetical protein n=1 Tax=Mesonia sp. TaxID=1960830 RepID=UPI003F95B307